MTEVVTSVVGKQISVLGLGLSEVLGPRNIITVYRKRLKILNFMIVFPPCSINFRWG